VLGRAAMVTAVVIGPHFDAVRQYDENAVQTNQVDVSALALTAAGMTSNVAAAFDAFSGGVINYDNGSFTDPKTIDAYFGVNKSLRITSGVRNWSIGVLGSSPSSGSISGPNVSFNGAPSPYPTPYLNDIIFGDVTDRVSAAVLGDRVTSFGFTIIDASFNGAGNDLHFDAFFSDGSSQSNNYTIPLAFQTQDTFFGWTAPAGQYITHISFTANNNTASDDWAFITAVVPEPTAVWACVSAGSIAMRRRRWTRKRGQGDSPIGARSTAA
jgi:hypothetical protein